MSSMQNPEKELLFLPECRDKTQKSQYKKRVVAKSFVTTFLLKNNAVGDILKKVEIYTDGACTGNPGKGGYGAVLIYNGNEKRISKGFRKTTNNRMELMAAIDALSLLKEACIVDLYSDSKYLTDAVNQKWLSSWQKNGWKKSDKKPVLNRDLWEKLLLLIEKHTVTFIWVKGHNGNPYNEICDTMAVEAYNNSYDNIDETYENL